MAIEIINKVTYQTDNEIIKNLGISSATFYDWIKKGRITPPNRFNHRGWRLWTEKEIKKVFQIKSGFFSLQELSN